MIDNNNARRGAGKILNYLSKANNDKYVLENRMLVLNDWHVKDRFRSYINKVQETLFLTT